MESPQKIKRMFSKIAKRYDFLNHLLSFYQDIYWRKSLANLVKKKKNDTIIDIACGTGDSSIEILKKTQKNVIGIDFCFEMLKIAKSKSEKIKFVNGDALELPLKNEVADIVTIAFGIRNILEREKALKEFFRILKKGGNLIIMEFSIPENFLFKIYIEKILPLIGSIFSDKEAYSYLPSSVKKFPTPDNFINEIKNSGFSYVSLKKLSQGTVIIYDCYKGMGD